MLSFTILGSGVTMGLLHWPVPAAILCGIAVCNEAARALVAATVARQPQAAEYQIPPRQRTPITYDEDNG